MFSYIPPYPHNSLPNHEENEIKQAKQSNSPNFSVSARPMTVSFKTAGKSKVTRWGQARLDLCSLAIELTRSRRGNWDSFWRCSIPTRSATAGSSTCRRVNFFSAIQYLLEFFQDMAKTTYPSLSITITIHCQRRGRVFPKGFSISRCFTDTGILRDRQPACCPNVVITSRNCRSVSRVVRSKKLGKMAYPAAWRLRLETSLSENKISLTPSIARASIRVGTIT